MKKKTQWGAGNIYGDKGNSPHVLYPPTTRIAGQRVYTYMVPDRELEGITMLYVPN